MKLSCSSAICSLLLLSVLLIFSGCKADPDTPFVELSHRQTGVDFTNRVENTPEFNIQNYLYFYDGGGVAAGDLNNNGLPDLVFISNKGEHKVYKNLGDFQFEDVTEASGIAGEPGSWSTGVTMADVNGNGYLDIYISRVNYLNKSGANQLFINNGDMTFTDRAAEFGIDFEGYSTQAAFFDYNNNGRLDLFILNHSFHSEHTYGQAERLRQRYDPKGGDKLFRNDGDRFTDVTREAGIISSALGYGLGLAITDINRNGYPDIYVGNDFHEDDYFYINNGDGTFTESVYSLFGHTSNSSMGNDIADISNNGRVDVVSLDMMAEDHETFMRSGGPDPMIVYNAKRNFGFGEKNNRNTLQVNVGDAPGGLPVFSETAFASGIARTEWSWAALLADFNNSGYNDLFVTNGMPKRPNDLDYVAALQRVRQQYSGDELRSREYDLIDRMPTIHVPNYMFRNRGDLTFEDVTRDWGFSAPSYSSGAVYVDLNGNGRLDLVVNNTNERAKIYRNNFNEEEAGNYLKVKLNGPEFNSTGIGTKLVVYHENGLKYREQFPTRGFQSSVDHVVHFGLGAVDRIDSLKVIWPGNRYEVLHNPEVNRLIEAGFENASGQFDYSRFHENPAGGTLLTDVTEIVNTGFRHRENTFDDFSREPLMPYKLSKRGPAMAFADVNGNGFDDLYLGGSRGFPGRLFLQQNDGSFIESEQPGFFTDRQSEDVDAIFFDANGNGFPDLYVVSGGNEFAGDSEELLDRLYFNDGNGRFTRSVNSVPDYAVNGSVVIAADINGNGHKDLFVGGHSVPWRYGIGPQSFIFENNGEGVFRNITEEAAPGVETVGNVTSATWVQQAETGLPDLVIAGEWMSVKYFENRNGSFEDASSEKGLDRLNGLWQSVHSADLTGNGHMDLIVGNFGINSRIEASHESPLRLFVNDFDGDGQTAPLIAYEVNGQLKPFEQLDELSAQIPDITQRVRSYRDFSSKTIYDLFEAEKIDEALKKQVTELRSGVLINNGNGGYEFSPFPFKAQLFPVMAIYVDDLDGDGYADVMLAGNIFDVKPGMGGRQDAGYGLLLRGNGSGSFSVVDMNQSGFFAKGESRAILPFSSSNGRQRLAIGINNSYPLFFDLNSTQPSVSE
jgi:enediyne biosynthesis protein E4